MKNPRKKEKNNNGIQALQANLIWNQNALNKVS